MSARSVTLIIALLCAWRPAAARAEAPARASDLTLDAELVAGLASTQSTSGDWSEFEARRLEVGGRWSGAGEAWGAELRLEGARSSGPESLNGIDGNSMVVRVKRGWAFGRLAPHAALRFEARAGLVPDLWVEAVEADYDLRALAPTTGEDVRFLSAADAGASVLASAFSGRVRVGFSLTNGEGYRQTELNSGKTTAIVGSIDALRFSFAGSGARLTAHVGWIEGSTGVARMPSGRLLSGLTFGAHRLGAGAEYLRADGAFGRALHADALGLYARGVVVPRWVGLALRFDRLNQDLGAADAVRERWSAGYFAEPFGGAERRAERLRIWLAAQVERAGDAGGPVPGAGRLGDLTRALVLLDFSTQTRMQAEEKP